MRLPVTIEFHSDEETPLSFASRLALANGYPSMAYFLESIGTDRQSVERGDPQAVRQLSQLSGVAEANLAKFGISINNRELRWRLGHAEMRRSMRVGSRHRFCAQCVLGDIDTGDNRPFSRPFVRPVWRTTAANNCVIHSCELTEVAASPSDRFDFARFVEANIGQIREFALAKKVALGVRLDAYVLNRVNGKTTNSFLDVLPAYIAVQLAQHMGEFTERANEDPIRRSKTFDLSRHERGFDVVSGGPATIEAAVCEAIVRRRPVVGALSSFFGPMHEWLKACRDNPDALSLTAIFQDIAERHLPLGPGDVFILPTTKRRIHSLRSASQEYGVLEDRLYKLLVEAEVIERSDRTSGQILFAVDAVLPLIARAKETMTSAEMREALGANDYQMLRILNANLLPRVEIAKKGGRTHHRVPRRDFEAFKSKLFSGGFLTDGEGFVSLAEAAQIARTPLEEVLRMVLAGNVRVLARIDNSEHLGSLRFDLAEIYQLFPRKSQNTEGQVEKNGLVTMKAAGLSLRVPRGAVTELKRRGLIKTTSTPPAGYGGHTTFVLEQSLNEFKTDFISIIELATATKAFVSQVRKELVGEGISPIFQPADLDWSFYRRDDVRHFLPIFQKD